jgi:hypothetical protein
MIEKSCNPVLIKIDDLKSGEARILIRLTLPGTGIT